LEESVPKIVSSKNSPTLSIFLPFFFRASMNSNIASENISSCAAGRKKNFRPRRCKLGEDESAAT